MSRVPDPFLEVEVVREPLALLSQQLSSPASTGTGHPFLVSQHPARINRTFAPLLL